MIAQQPTFEELLETIRKNTCDSTLEIEQDFNDAIIMQIANAIPQNSNLLSLTLRHRFSFGVEVISTEATKALIDAVRTRTSLVSLDLGFHLEKGGAEAIAILLQQSITLQAFYLGNSNALPIGRGHDRGHPSIGVVILATALDQNPKSILDTFCLRHNWFGKEGAEALTKALRKIPTFKNLTLLHCQIGSEGARGLAPLFQHSETLEDVNLDGNYIDNDGVIALINALNQNRNSSLKSWNLGSNGIRKTGMIALAKFLKHNLTLEALYLVGNKFHEIHRSPIRHVKALFKIIIDIVVPIAIMQVLFIPIGNALTDASPSHALAIHYLCAAISYISALAIILKRNSIDNKKLAKANDKKELAEAATEIVELANALTLNATLKILDLSQNHIHDEDAIALARALDPSNPNQKSVLESFNLSFSMIGDKAAIAFARILPRNRSLVTLNLANNSIGSPGGKALLEALSHKSIWNTPLLNLILGSTYPYTSPPVQIDEQIQQSIDSILKHKSDFLQRQTEPWSELSVLIAFYRANSTSAIRTSVFDVASIIRAYANLPPRPRITSPAILPPQNPQASNAPLASEELPSSKKNH